MKVLCFLTLLFWMQFAYAQRINFKTIGNHMIADVMINDSVAAKAFIDTGCPITIIDSTFAVNSGFKINQEGKRLRYHTFSSTSYCYPLMDDTINVNGLRSSRPVYVGNLKRRKGVRNVSKAGQRTSFHDLSARFSAARLLRRARFFTKRKANGARPFSTSTRRSRSTRKSTTV